MDARRFSTRQGRLVEKSRRWSGPMTRSGMGAKAGCAFFGPLFLCTSKERCARSPSGERKLLLLLLLPLCFQLYAGWREHQGKHQRKQGQGLSLPLRGASYFSLLVQRKASQKKARPACAPDVLRTPGSLHWQDFSTRRPCLVEKRRTSMYVAPSGVLSASSVAAEGNPVRQQPKQLQKHQSKASSQSIKPKHQAKAKAAAMLNTETSSAGYARLLLRAL